ncbi:MAG: hypothetical protein ACE5GB_07865 [Acidimicrobiales bacterium]
MIPYQFRLERRLERRWWHDTVTPLISIIAALVAGAVFLLIEGFNPLTVYRELFEASFTTKFGFTDSLTIAVPLMLTGLSAAVAFRMSLFNIGAEGQLYLGAIFGSWAGLALAGDLPTILGVLVVLAAGALRSSPRSCSRSSPCS